MTFSAARPPERRYERAKVPHGTLGAAFRNRRWQRKMGQREAAAEIGVPIATYRRWETNQAVPTLKHLPSAIAFLGYDWRPAPQSLGESLRFRRTRLGSSLREIARRAGVDWTTIRAWERDEQRPTKRLLAAVERALALATSSTIDPIGVAAAGQQQDFAANPTLRLRKLEDFVPGEALVNQRDRATTARPRGSRHQ